MARVYYSNSSTGTSTTTNSAYTSKVTVTFTPTSGKTYAIFWSATIWGASTASDVNARLYNITDAAILQLYNIEIQDSTDRMLVSDVSIFTAASGTNRTFGIQFSSESVGTTVSIADAYISVLELFPDEQYSTTAAQTSQTSATYTTLNSVTVPAGNWYLIGSLGTDLSAIAAAYARISDGTNHYSVRTRSFSQDTSNYTPYFGMAVVAPSASTTYNLQYASDGTNTVAVRYRTIVALKKANFREAWSAVDETTSTTTSTTDQTKLSLSVTPTFAVAHLILASWTVKGSSTALSTISAFHKAGVSVFTQTIQREPSDTTDEMAGGFAETETQTTSTVAWSIVYDTENGATASILNTAIIILNLATDVPRGYSFSYILD